MFRIVLVFAAVSAVYGQSTSVDRCLHNAGELPLNTHIVGCSSPPCVLPQGQNAVVNVQFQPERPVRSMRTLATAYLRVGFITIPVPYPLGEYAETCNFLEGASCPVAAGQQLQLSLGLFIEEFFPIGTAVTVEFRVVDESNAPLLCFSAPLRISGPARK